MKKSLFLILTLIALCPSGMAQLVPLVSGSGNELSLDLGRVYNYNQYEKSRWGVGLQYDFFLGEGHTRILSLSGYGAYGYEDERLKWGLKADLQSFQCHQSHTYVEFFHDVVPDASRYLSAYRLTNFNSTGSFMTRLFSDTYRLTLGFSRQATAQRTDCFELRLSRERYLHYGATQVYPSSYSELKGLPHEDFLEGHVFIAHASGFRGDVLAGIHGDFAGLFSEGERQGAFLRLLTQYDKAFFFSAIELDFFAQGGFVGSNALYSRLFDLGGTWGSPLALERSLLTARPNEFICNLFTLVNLKLTTQEPLFRVENKVLAIGTAPSPFVLCDAAWGRMGDYSGPNVPDKGIAEVGAGIDGLVVWGAVRWGGAIVYRLTPPSASYHFTDSRDNLALLFTAQLDM